MVKTATLTMAATCAALLGACGSDSQPAPAESANADAHRMLLASLSDKVFIPKLQVASAEAGKLQVATSAWLLDVASDDARDAARNQWANTMRAWQEVELLQIGPAGGMGTVAGGQDLRDRIYSWPLTNRCRVDQETLEDAWQNPASLEMEAANVVGLDALEYLLFFEGEGNDCSELSAINTDGSWDALTPAERRERKAGYADALAAKLAIDVNALLGAWDPLAGNFAAELAGAGRDSATYPTAQAALNALTDALFYIEEETKDMKLAKLLGLSEDCPELSCPDALESPFAEHGLANVDANLAMFDAVFHGADDGLGFDDLLTDMGAGALASEMSAAIAAAKQAVEAVAASGNSFTQLIATNPDALLPIHDTLRALGLLLKTQFLSVLDLELPERAEGDND